MPNCSGDSAGPESFSNAGSFLPLEVGQGATLSLSMVWKDANGSPIDLTGYTARMKIRSSADAQTVLYDASSKITLGGALGTIVLNVPDDDTAAFTWDSGVYFLEIEKNSATTRLLRGTVQVSKVGS